MAGKSVAIVGTRGVPNLYGGFEQFAEYVSVGLVEKGYEVIVYNPHFHPYDETEFRGVGIVKKWCPENRLGAAAHIVYDWICLRDAIKRGVDVVLELGYQSSAISMLLAPISKTRVLTNMDGMEWKRQKWSPAVKRFTRWAEKVAANKSHALVSDNVGIQDYLMSAYGKESMMIPYGAEVFSNPNLSLLADYELDVYSYYLLIARIEPENNIETILDGYLAAKLDEPFVVVGGCNGAYGQAMLEKYKDSGIRFLGGIYDIEQLNNLRYYAKAYFHGHSVGGTNPSLLEAMASSAFIMAHGNIFNRSVLGEGAAYFESSSDVTTLFDKMNDLKARRGEYIERNLQVIGEIYTWDRIVEQYSDAIERVCKQ